MTYTAQQTREFKRLRNAKSNFEKRYAKSKWERSFDGKSYRNNVTGRRGIFNPGNRTMTILN